MRFYHRLIHARWLFRFPDYCCLVKVVFTDVLPTTDVHLHVYTLQDGRPKRRQGGDITVNLVDVVVRYYTKVLAAEVEDIMVFLPILPPAYYCMRGVAWFGFILFLLCMV